jgi:hypothetical protein
MNRGDSFDGDFDDLARDYPVEYREGTSVLAYMFGEEIGLDGANLIFNMKIDPFDPVYQHMQVEV